jgi:hypothetical protein
VFLSEVKESWQVLVLPAVTLRIINRKPVSSVQQLWASTNILTTQSGNNLMGSFMLSNLGVETIYLKM